MVDVTPAGPRQAQAQAGGAALRRLGTYPRLEDAVAQAGIDAGAVVAESSMVTRAGVAAGVVDQRCKRTLNHVGLALGGSSVLSWTSAPSGLAYE